MNTPLNPNEIPKMPSVTDVEKDPKPEKPKNNYRVMSAEDIKESKDWVKRTVPEWHDKVNPDVVLLTETSAVQFGWLLRNAWKEAYPNQKIPKFYRSDIGSETSYGTSRLWRQEDLIECEIKNGYLKKRNIILKNIVNK